LCGRGPQSTLTARLCVSYRVGNRDLDTALSFMHDLESRLANRVQITTDQFGAYMTAVDTAFVGVNGVDFAMLQKIYKGGQQQGRYNPPVCIGCTRVVEGDPDPKHISTRYVERQNLSLRMHMRRFTRLTNGFSKKLENHAATVALYFMFYNFGRVHQTLRVTPAMETGVSDHI
jgi:IS1 family transposase